MCAKDGAAPGGFLSDDHDAVGALFGGVYAAIEGGDVPGTLKALDYLWARLAVHIRAEHLRLFPSILGAARPLFTGDGGAPPFEEAERAVALLKRDHDFFMRELAAAVNTLRALKASPAPEPGAGELEAVRRVVSGVEERLGAHNELEERQLYRWTEALLGRAEADDLAAAIRRELDNEPPRFGGSGEDPAPHEGCSKE
jgi:hypothetical protein